MGGEPVFELILADEKMFFFFRTCYLQMGEGGKGRPRNRLNIKSLRGELVIVSNMVTSATVYIMFCSAFSFPIVVTVP